jgi:hypothetical protein
MAWVLLMLERVLVAVEMCLPAFPSYGRIFWVGYSSFQPSCHNNLFIFIK